MHWEGIPVWGLGLIIFLLRIGDVSLGTVRTIAVVQGRIAFSVALGFIEVLIWLLAVTQVFQHAVENPYLLLCYAAGFAAGNAVGIQVERRLALGYVILRIITSRSEELVTLLHKRVAHVTTFAGKGPGPVGQDVVLLYLVCKRRDVPELIAAARGVDPELFFAADPLRESSVDLATPLPHPTGWRSIMKMK